MASVHTPKNIKDLSLDEQDYLVEWVQGEQDGDRNWQSEIEELVYTLEDAITWLTDNEYDWKNMVAKEFSTYPIVTSIEQAHIVADDHARRCDDENCGWCDYDSSDVDYGDAIPSA